MKNKEDFMKFYDGHYKNIINEFFQKELKKYNKIKSSYILKNIFTLLLKILFYRRILDFNI